MSLDKKVSDLLPMQIPDYVQEFYPVFVIFVTKYFEWLEQTGNPQEVIQNIQLDVDIDTTATSLATKFMAMYAPNLPQTSALDRSVLIKHFRDFYRSRGSEESYRYFFRAFFNDEISIKLPGDQLFKTSDADWYIEKVLRVAAVTGDPRQLAAVEITGTSSNATAVVEEVVNSYGAWDLRLQNRSLVGTFNSSETITGTYYDYDNNTSSQITVLNTAPLEVLPGRQRGTNSLLSANQIIQDSNYWQKFSYVLRTRIDLSRWQDAVLEQLHPTGRNLFGEILIDNTTSLAVSSATLFARSNAIESEVRLFTSSMGFYLVPGFTWDRLADYRTGTSATTTAGAIVYDAGFAYAGENVTFALQNLLDAGAVSTVRYDLTSITGTVNIGLTTGTTATNRDLVTYTMPVTSIAGTINAAAQDIGDSITLTGTSTLFSSQLSTNRVWRRVESRDALNNPVYAYYSSLLTLRALPITGTLTIAAQTPTAPNFIVHVSGTNTRFLSDLLITQNSSGAPTETSTPLIASNQPQPLLFLNDMPILGDIEFVRGSTTATGTGTVFSSDITRDTTATLTVIKPLRGRFFQISSIASTTTSYESTVTIPALYLTVHSSTTLSFSLTTSNYSSIGTAVYGTDRSTRYDIPLPFPVWFVTGTTNTLYVHASGFISGTTSMPSIFGSGTQFRPFQAPFFGIVPNNLNLLRTVRHDSRGTAPNRYYTVRYEGQQNRAYVYNYVSQTNGTSMTIRGRAALGASSVLTSGSATNGYYELSLPWTISYAGTSYNTIYVSHNGRVGFGDWILYNSSTTLTTSTAIRQPGALISLSISPLAVPIAQSVQRLHAATLGTAPNRSYIVRYEGDSSTTQTDGNSKIIWEMEFPESSANTTSNRIHIHFDHPAQLPESYAIGVYENLSRVNYHGVVWDEVQAGDAFAATALVFQYTNSYYPDLNSTTRQTVLAPLTSTMSLLQTFNRIGYFAPRTVHTTFSGGRFPFNWEMDFPENSSSPYILRTGYPHLYGVSPVFTYYGYGQSSGTTYVPKIEVAERASSNALVHLMPTNETLYNSSTYTLFFTRRDARPELVSAIPTSNAPLLLRTFNAGYYGDDTVPPSTTVGFGELGLGLFPPLAGVAPGALACDTSTGVIHRFPRDGFTATTANPNPNPSVPITSQSVTFAYNRGGLISGTDYNTFLTSVSGILFSYGSSISTASRFIQTAPQIFSGDNGISFAINFLVGTGNTANTSSISPYYSTLAPTVTGEDLELWYSNAENPTPPLLATDSPASFGWTRAVVLHQGGATNYSFGGVKSLIHSITTSNSVPWSWLIWQKSFTAQTTADQRTSEYLITGLRIQASQLASTAAKRNVISNNRSVLSSGSVVRVPVRTTQAGATTPQDFYVAEDPAARGNYGDSYLVLQPVTPISGVSYPYTAVINSYSADGGATTSYGLYNVSMNQLQLNLVETRTVSSIVNVTTLTVTAAWSSNNLRSFASASSGFATRAFAINSVNSDTSLSLRSAASATTSFNSRITATITSTTTLADRRFSVVSITNNTTITVSGGGIYSATTDRTALFARPETTSGATAIEGYVISGDHDVSTLTANTTWVSSGLPGIDSIGVDRGTNLQTLTLNIGNSSFTVVRVINNTTVLVTGNVITNNFFDTSMVSQFPGGIADGTVTGTGTKFAATSALISGITRTTEEVTIFNNSDTRTGYLSVSGQLLRVVNIINNTTITVTGAVTFGQSVAGATAVSFRRVSETPAATALVRPGGASFDKFGANITNDDTIVVQDAGLNTSVVTELYHSPGSLNFAAGSTILSTSVLVQYIPQTEITSTALISSAGVFTNALIMASSVGVATAAIGTGAGSNGGFNTYAHFRFGDVISATAPRLLTTRSFNQGVSSVGFRYIAGNNSNGGETPDSNENLVLQYNTSGAVWITAATVRFGGGSTATSWTSTSIAVGTQVPTRIRWLQTQFSGSGIDNYGVTDVQVFGANTSRTLLMVTWVKDLTGNEDENLNQLTVSVSSTLALRFFYDDEIQRNHRDIAVARSLMYNNSVYLNSSNSITSTNVVLHGDSTSTAVWAWTPYNIRRAGTYSRLSVLIENVTSTSISIGISVPTGKTWNSLETDFLNITALGAQ